MNTIMIRGGRIIDPSQEVDRVGNLVLKNGRVEGIDVATPVAETVIDARGLIVCPGLIDCQVSLREPGFEEDETIATGTAAALAGGMATVACMPDTYPVVDDRSAAEFILLQSARAAHCHVFTLGAITKNNEGKELAEIGQLVEVGAVGFTDGKRPVANAEVMRRAFEYTQMFDRPVLTHPQVPELIAAGVMHEGFVSTQLGFRGMPAAAEEIMVARDIALAEMTGGRVHLMCVSAIGSVELVRHAKARGVRVTASVAPHNLVLTDADLQNFDPNLKVNPPLRTQDHIDSLFEGLRDGTIDAISSDHQPYAAEKKDRELDLAPFGIAGLETLLPICIQSLIDSKHLSWSELIAKLTVAPASILGIEKGTLAPGADADVTLIDPELEWTIQPEQFASKSRNNPFADWTVHGRTQTVIVAGQVRYERNEER